PHIKEARKADLIIIAPATADLLAKIATGLADDLLTNIVLASDAPLILIPAMHPEMWSNPATVENVKKLRARGALVIEPDEGRMTGEDFGVGRYPDISRAILEISNFVNIKSDLLGRKVLVTAGGTREALDPIRYIGNRSSGNQGFAIARAARNRGAEVVLLAANVQLEELAGVRTIKVESTAEMQEILVSEFPKCEILIMSAAIADARPKNYSAGKIKKDKLQSIELETNPDLLQQLSKTKSNKQIIIAFAAETGELDIPTAHQKLQAKGADLLFLNDVSGGAVFGSDETSGFIINSDGDSFTCAVQSKDTLADLLLDKALDKLGSTND
ncbi:MAG: bifunctional phosphopantothenoylcysteine decarboxylase/phosphopantothenate--cysteine ligase CoaBC, partial [Actinobacteria bacterium]|nr:bifunctional phosphopantothenoylcysteine decarboxylase/phosphopantothenate--cysteine ligase CoaBC [Actinomycetota bacterium]